MGLLIGFGCTVVALGFPRLDAVEHTVMRDAHGSGSNRTVTQKIRTVLDQFRKRSTRQCPATSSPTIRRRNGPPSSRDVWKSGSIALPARVVALL